MKKAMTNNWIATYYDKEGGIILTETFIDRTEHEADSEAVGLMPYDCEDWSLQPIKPVFKFGWQKINSGDYDNVKDFNIAMKSYLKTKN
jgi:hypothetical protein